VNYLQGKIIKGSFWKRIVLKEYLLIIKSFNITNTEKLLNNYLIINGRFILIIPYLLWDETIKIV
jgi:hypothetical protein